MNSRGLTFNAPLVRSQLRQDNPLVRKLVDAICSDQDQQKLFKNNPQELEGLKALRDRGTKYYENLKAGSPPKYLLKLMGEMKLLAEELTEIIEDVERFQGKESKELLAVAQMLDSLDL